MAQLIFVIKRFLFIVILILNFGKFALLIRR